MGFHRKHAFPTVKLTVFTAQRYIAAVYVIDLSLSVRLAVTRRSHTKTAIDVITKVTPHAIAYGM